MIQAKMEEKDLLKALKEREENNKEKVEKYISKHKNEFVCIRYEICDKKGYVKSAGGGTGIIFDKKVYEINKNFNEITLNPIPNKEIRSIVSENKDSELEKKILTALKENKSKVNINLKLIRK